MHTKSCVRGSEVFGSTLWSPLLTFDCELLLAALNLWELWVIIKTLIFFFPRRPTFASVGPLELCQQEHCLITWPGVFLTPQVIEIWTLYCMRYYLCCRFLGDIFMLF